MVSSSHKIKNVGEVKRTVKSVHECPFCKEKFEIGVEWDTLNQLNEEQYFPYPHLHIHGNPLHAMLCYIDKDLHIRSVSKIKSIEVSRDSDTLSQLMKKWSNPY